jgi:hypothetical protein
VVELLHRERTIKVKIVYYGPPVGGKTTNLQVLHQHAQAQRRGEFISINSAQDRTILFDLLPLKAPGFRGYDLRIQTVAVPGQPMYAATRRLILKNADACVFVANSAADRWEENLSSFREMTQNLLAHQLDPAALPLVLQYNKRDLPETTPLEFMDRALNARKADAIPAVALRGEGVLETFSAVLLRSMQDLSHRYQIGQSLKNQPLSQWTQTAILGMFGTTSLALEPNPLPPEPAPRPSPGGSGPVPPPPPEPPPVRELVRVAMSAEVEKMAGMGPDARANETLVESYAKAGEQLSSALAFAKEERDAMRRRVEDLQQVLSAAQGLLAGQPLDPTLRAVLQRVSDAAGADCASFLMARPDKSLRAAAFRGSLSEDPLLRTKIGQRYVQARMVGEHEARLHTPVDALDLGDALEASEPRFSAVLAVPVRTPRALLGLALLYYLPDAALPTPEVLVHLGLVARALSSSLELHATLETVRGAERSLELALQGTASVRGLSELVTFLEGLRDEFADLRRRPDIPPWFLSEFSKLSPGLAGALATSRALVAFTRGAIEREPVAVDEIVSDLQGENVEIQSSASGRATLGDRVLLRLALKALVDQARHGVSEQRARLQLAAEAGRLRVRLSGSPPPAGLPDVPLEGSVTTPGLALGFVRRVVELHGGELAADKSPGGPLYTLNLPLA